ncbi:MAG TPA: 3-dehydroquinate synthase [Pyrinomonadaceae bacterium]|nr:3-dehydroquinate synthase [Pyrinomonadaceae bacterium]
MPKLTVRVPARPQSYDIKIGGRLLERLGNEVRAAVGPGARRAALITNKTVFKLYGDRVTESLKRTGFSVNHWLMRDGEQHKSFSSLERAVEFFSEAGLERNDVVVALGGGVVGDLAGFAASVYLRGIAFVQVPTTLLAQIDSSVGGKTGINLPSGKNRVGAFHQPRLVIIDIDTLKTLPARELTSGFCEMVKQGVVGDRKLFNRTVRLLSRRGSDLAVSPAHGPSPPDLAATIAAHCRFKARIVANDEREAIDRTDPRSRRILNFGHTTAHALEKVTKYQHFRHGEAVGYGMLVAAELSKSLGRLPADALESLREAVKLCGPLPRADGLSAAKLIAAMTADKKAVEGKLKWVLLDDIGRPRIVDSDKIKPEILCEALTAGLANLL